LAQPGRQVKHAAVDLKVMSAADLRQLIEDAQAELRGKQEASKAELRAKWEREAAEAGLTLDAALPMAAGAAKAGQGSQKRRKDTGGTLPVKFKDPDGEE
jgi:hypothetical protein